MKIFGAIVFLLLVITATPSTQWKKGDKRLEDTADRKSLNGFGAHLLVVQDPQGFIEEWAKPQTPKINLATKVKRGESIGVLILFAGCKPNAQGECSSEVDYLIFKPDGSVYVERKSEPLWKEKAPPVPNIQLGRAILGLQMEPDDPAGEYRVKAKVYDLNADISFELETKFNLK